MDLRDVRFCKPACCATWSSGSKVEESFCLNNLAATPAYAPNISPLENCYMGGEQKHLFEVVLLACICTSSAWSGTEGPVDCRFSWDEAKYPIMTPLREVVDSIQDGVAKLEDDLKVCKAQLHCILLCEKKQNMIMWGWESASILFRCGEKRSFCWTSFRVIFPIPLWLSLWVELL